jgi:hypothetical protein
MGKKKKGSPWGDRRAFDFEEIEELFRLSFVKLFVNLIHIKLRSTFNGDIPTLRH